MTLIRDIFDIPTQVHQGDFVLRLGEGLLHPQTTLQSYVVTPKLVGCFQRAMGLIESALKTGTSKGAYLHGSFGSGKSHFMAVLSLLLRNDPTACAVPELAEVVVAHRHWTGADGRRLLLVPYHMVGAASMEAAVFGQYTETVRRLHPQAPLPGFFLAADLFRDAQNLRVRLGDAAFFDGLNGDSGSAGDDGEGWGSIAVWDAASFDAVLAMPPDLDQRSSAFQERQRLVGALAGSYFQAVRSQSAGGEGLVPLDAGLAIMSRHAQQLGYEGVVLFLDELILWLASHAAEPSFLNREGQKVAKLVESEHADRPVPLVSFIARQRDLRELVGQHLPGAELLGFADVLNYWEARFDTIALDDRDLPAIAAKRLLQPRSPAARQSLEAAFAKSAGARQEVLDALLTRDGDREMFRQLYPFSPALVQTLIALSSLLQRERTALRLMLQLLVRYRDTLEVGDIVPVGDLFDVIMAGDEPFMQALRLRFDDARRLYRQKLLPMLEVEHGVSAADVEAGRIEAGKRNAFVNDGRLLKTLLLSALADGVEALSGLTAARLAALNHGSVRSPIPGQEGSMVLTRLRRWAAQVGEIKIGEGSNPAISLHLAGVDTDGILANAADGDNYGNRVRRIRALLFEALAITEAEGLLAPVYTLSWRGTSRDFEVVVHNVRELSNTDLKPDRTAWRIVIDYPFDREGHGPQDDITRLENFSVEVPEGARTLVWLPAWLNTHGQADLGRLNLLEHALSGSNLERFGSHLSLAEREAARSLLQNQRDQLRQRLRNLLQAAYGVSAAETGGIDRTHGLNEHFRALLPGLRLRPPVGSELKQCLEDLLTQALDHQYPAHPAFDIELKPALLRRCWEELARAAQRPDGRIELDRDRRDDIRRVVVPLALADMNPAGPALKLRTQWHEFFDRPLRQSGQSVASVRQLREWLDQPQARGLTRPVQNLLICLYALGTDRQFFRHGARIDVAQPEQIDDELELRQRALPAAAQWQTAQERAGAIFGLGGDVHRSSVALDRFAAAVQEAVRAYRPAVVRYQRQLGLRARALGVADSADRLRTAAATEALLTALDGRDAAATVATLAQAEIASSQTAMGECLKQAERLAEVCGQLPDWHELNSLAALPDGYRESTDALRAALCTALAADEHVAALDAALSAFRSEVKKLLLEAAAKPVLPPAPAPRPLPVVGTATPPPAPPLPAPSLLGTGRGDVTDAETLMALVQTLREQLEAHPGARLELHWALHAQGPQP